ncbi:hypothetical protein [Paraburkholderia unamae]|uniref:Uncharacterized protein n=1 Tax=Paraburkholderia unamae TaxID=219649 RepID=A0ACC6RGV1_9BURK
MPGGYESYEKQGSEAAKCDGGLFAAFMMSFVIGACVGAMTVFLCQSGVL